MHVVAENDLAGFHIKNEILFKWADPDMIKYDVRLQEIMKTKY